MPQPLASVGMCVPQPLPQSLASVGMCVPQPLASVGMCVPQSLAIIGMCVITIRHLINATRMLSVCTLEVVYIVKILLRNNTTSCTPIRL